MDDLTNYEARATIMWASSLAHNGLTDCGRENYLAVHQLEHAVSGLYDNVAHGAGLAVLYPAWAKYIYKYNTQRFSQFARRVFDVNEQDDEKASIIGIQKLQEFFVRLEMPTKLSDFDISDSQIDNLANLCTYNKTRTIKSYIDLGFSEIKEILKLCY
jgi:alcohol dehydrogenase YqhD (iron-dependent ADH family)